MSIVLEYASNSLTFDFQARTLFFPFGCSVVFFGLFCIWFGACVSDFLFRQSFVSPAHTKKKKQKKKCHEKSVEWIIGFVGLNQCNATAFVVFQADCVLKSVASSFRFPLGE